MDPVRSSIGAGVVASVVVSVLLLVGEFLVPEASLFTFSTLRSLCVIGGPPYCEAGGTGAFVLRAVVYLALFVVAWPLLFAGFTWGLPGESGTTHGGVYGVFLWAGYLVAVVYGVGYGGGRIVDQIPLVTAALVAYLVYGLVLGSVYDHLAAHRTLMSTDST
ncbi:DUF6789 family protein [Halobacteriales archaeon Cl-PHB]